jgi:hypothetical protein
VTRPAAHALWRAAPLRLARTPGWGVLVLVAATLFVGSVVAPTLFVDTARSTALSEGLAAGSGSPYGDESGDLRVTWDGVVRDERVVLDPLAAMPAYGAPTLTATGVGQTFSRRPIAVANGASTRAVLWYHDGAVEALGAGPDEEGVWLSTEAARSLGLTPGDAVRIGMSDSFLGAGRILAPTVLAGTYDTAPGSVLPAALADLPEARRWFLPGDPTRGDADSPLAIVGRSTFERLVRRVNESPFYVADLLLEPDVSPDRASDAVDRIDAFDAAAFDGTTDLYGQLAGAKPAPATVEVITGLPEITEAADDTARSAREQVRPYAVGGEVLAALLLVAAWVLLGLGRRREQLFLSGLGLRPLGLAALAALEVLPACALAVPAGLALAHLGVAAAGPPAGVGLPVTGDEVGRAAVGAAVGLLLVATTAYAAAVATDRLDRISRLGRGRASVPWGTALVAATAVVAFAVLSTDPGDRASSPLTPLFPFLVTGTVAMLVVRAVSWLRARRSTRARPGTPRWLAARRTGPVLREVTALASVVAVALGLFAYTLTVQRGIHDGVADKTAALSGAATTIEVANGLRAGGADRAVSPPVDGSTVVWRRGVVLAQDFGQVPLMALDPDTFADVADWGGSGDLDAGRALLPRLTERTRGLPVVLAGDTQLQAGAQTTLTFDGSSVVPVYVLDVVPAFPGSEGEVGAVAVVASSSRLFRLVPPNLDPRRPNATIDKPGAFTSAVWSNDSPADLRSAFAEADLETDGQVATAAAARIDNGLVASTWAADYVLALGLVVLVLALAAGLVLARRLADRDTVSDVLLVRMGYRAGDLARARAWEVGYAVGTAVVAALLAVGVLVLAPTTIDATVRVPPVSHPRPAATDAIAVAVVLVVLVLAAWLIGTLVVRRRPAAEVLRAGD